MLRGFIIQSFSTLYIEETRPWLLASSSTSSDSLNVFSCNISIQLKLKAAVDIDLISLPSKVLRPSHAGLS